MNTKNLDQADALKIADELLVEIRGLERLSPHLKTEGALARLDGLRSADTLSCIEEAEKYRAQLGGKTTAEDAASDASGAVVCTNLTDYVLAQKAGKNATLCRTGKNKPAAINWTKRICEAKGAKSLDELAERRMQHGLPR
jgi:hypothetical protein